MSSFYFCADEEGRGHTLHGTKLGLEVLHEHVVGTAVQGNML